MTEAERALLLELAALVARYADEDGKGIDADHIHALVTAVRREQGMRDPNQYAADRFGR
jgi:hypothetical protein